MKGLVLLGAVIMQLMTAACGQKGPLYLPPRNGTVVTRPAGSNATTPNTPSTTDQQPSSTPQTPPQSSTPGTTTPHTPPQSSTPGTTAPQTTGPGPTGKKSNDDSSQPPK
jgi:predicted small lipoprotein YifL